MMRHENLKLKLEHEHRLEYRTIGTRTWNNHNLLEHSILDKDTGQT